MEKVITAAMGKSSVIPPVTIRIPMPPGAGTPAPSQKPTQNPPQTRPAK